MSEVKKSYKVHEMGIIEFFTKNEVKGLYVDVAAILWWERKADESSPLKQLFETILRTHSCGHFLTQSKEEVLEAVIEAKKRLVVETENLMQQETGMIQVGLPKIPPDISTWEPEMGDVVKVLSDNRMIGAGVVISGPDKHGEWGIDVGDHGHVDIESFDLERIKHIDDTTPFVDMDAEVPLSTERFYEIRGRLQDLPPGKWAWYWDKGRIFNDPTSLKSLHEGKDTDIIWSRGVGGALLGVKKHTQEFIANAKEDMQALIDEVIRLSRLERSVQ